jgi:heparan-sulfate lyase
MNKMLFAGLFCIIFIGFTSEARFYLSAPHATKADVFDYQYNSFMPLSGDRGQKEISSQPLLYFNTHNKTDLKSAPGILNLLNHLDLNSPGLAKVKAAWPDSLAAADELLSFYRSRTSVKHPADRRSRSAESDDGLGDTDLKVADDALKHIFIGQSAYPPYFCGKDINWGSRPVPDNEWVWQLNRMYFWDAMARAYLGTKDEKYAKEWCCQLVDWTRKNPQDEQHAFAWRTIEAGIRGYSWTGLFQAFLDSPSLTPEVLIAFLNSCHDHAEFLMTRYSKGNNWALMEAEGMAFIAITFPEFRDSKKWRNEAIARLNQEASSQVYPDGQQRELAMDYHMGCIGWFTRTYDLARANGQMDAFPESYIKIVEKMCEVPLKLELPDGSSAQFGDSWTGQPGHLWGSLLSWGKLYNRPDFLYVATEGKEGKAPESTAFALDKSGLYSMRSGWDKNTVCLVLKCGPDGGWHCQPDNGTFELYAGGRHLMPDAGSYIYSGDPENRAWFRQTKVHQTLTLNGKNTNYAAKLLLWKPGKDLDVLVVENAGYPDLTHRRAVFFVDKKYFLIVDEAIGSGTGDIDLHFQLGPGNALVNQDDFTASSDFKDGYNVLVKSMAQKGMTLHKEEGQVSFDYTKKEPRPAFCYSLKKEEKNSGIRFVTLVVPYSGEQPKVKAAIAGNPAVGDSHLEVSVSAFGKSRQIGYDLSAK